MKYLGALVLVIAVMIFGFIQFQKMSTGKEVAEVVKKHYGYTDSEYKFNLVSLTNVGGGQSATMKVTYIKDGTSWKVNYWNVFGNWDRATEQMKMDTADIDAVGNCLNSLAGGVRIGGDVYNSKDAVDSCREAMRIYKIKHPDSDLGEI